MTEDKVRKLIEQGDNFGGNSKFELAIESYDQALAIDPENVEVWISRGLCLSHLGLPNEAIASFDEVLAVYPKIASERDVSAALGFRAGELFAMGRLQEAVENYEKAKEFDSGNFPDWQARLKWDAINKAEQWLKVRRPTPVFTELYELVMGTEIMLRIFVRQRLQLAYGDEESQWWLKGVPGNIRENCAQMVERDLHSRKRDKFDCMYLIDLKTIIDKQWKLFEQDFKKVKGDFKSKQEFLERLVSLNDIRNLVAHPAPNDSLEKFLDDAKQIRGVIERFSGPD